jgi:hypothetical protein
MKKQDRRYGSVILRILISAAGLGLAAFGILGLKNGVWVYKTFSERYGRPTVAFVAEWIGLGLLLFLVGALPWEKWLERRNSRGKF